jgi:hypothetical protein
MWRGRSGIYYTTDAVRLIEEHFLTSLVILHALHVSRQNIICSCHDIAKKKSLVKQQSLAVVITLQPSAS